jgi:cold shock CspA family protein
MDYAATTAVPDTAAQHGKRRRKSAARGPRAHATRGRAKGEKVDQRGLPTTGRVARILYGQGFGFIRIDERRDVFFHRKDVFGGMFNELSVDDGVTLELIEDALTGPRAVRVAVQPKQSSAA